MGGREKWKWVRRGEIVGRSGCGMLIMITNIPITHLETRYVSVVDTVNTIHRHVVTSLLPDRLVGGGWLHSTP